VGGKIYNYVIASKTESNVRAASRREAIARALGILHFVTTNKYGVDLDKFVSHE
jgi:hypothetical protein